MNLRMLRLFLVFSALGWVVCVIGVFQSWASFTSLLHGLGGPSVAYDRMLDYWVRMTAGVYTLIGLLYLLLALQPVKYRVVIPWFGWVMVVEGCVLLVHGIRLGLSPFPFYADVTACFLGGGGILWFARRVERNQPAPGAEPPHAEATRRGRGPQLR